MWLQDFIGELVLQENPTGTTSKTKSTTWKKGFLGFLLKSADDVFVFLVFFDVFGIKKDFCAGTKKRSDIAATPPFLDLLFSNYQLSIVNCQLDYSHSSQFVSERYFTICSRRECISPLTTFQTTSLSIWKYSCTI